MQKLVVRSTQLQLPTTAKLFGALGLAMTGFFTAELMVPYLPVGTKAGGLALMMTSFGLLLGWRVIGMNPGRGRSDAMHRGLRASFYLVTWGMVFLGSLQMMHEALRGRYDGVMAALTDVISKGISLASAVLQLDVLAVLFLGGVLSAMLAEWAWKQWHA
ncbi:MAG: TrgA family protein [Paenirhodobacter sp.]|uniref:TrgA family protein n=1 Tax=Paenirhodobacter sp. TaxID=1965326 RepID=UPI003D13156F